MGQEDSFSAGHMPPAICFYFLCPTLGIPSFLSAGFFQFFIFITFQACLFLKKKAL